MEMMMIIINFITVLGAYFVGSVPSGYLLARLLKGIDIRQHGSGNIGASNAARVLGKRYFIAVLLLDACKAWGWLALTSYFYSYLSISTLYCGAIALLLGNAYSLFLHFSGGKGVATSIGIIAFFYPWWLTALFAFSWLITVIFVKPFLASFVSFFLFILGVFIVPGGHHKIFGLAIVSWMIFRHLPNIKKWK